MGYSDQITIIKNSLNRFEAEEQKLSELYKTAIENAKNYNKEAIKALNKDYYDKRNEAYADSARNERNLNNQLAARGLGFSGEAAQAKLGANVSLSGRLSDIARQKSESEKEYNLKLADTIADLSMEEADKLRELLNSKTQINLQIADMELEKETADADRASEKQLSDDRIKAEKELLEAELQAEQDALATKLKAEKELAKAELEAKYGASYSNNSTVNGNTEASEAYTPDVKPQELAKQVTGGKHISDEDGEYAVNKFLLGLKNNYNVDPEYYDQLVFMLTTYGYEPVTEPEMRTMVITHEARAYNSDTAYEGLYNSYVANGDTPSNAKIKAKETILKNQMDYVYKNVKNNTEFRICCIGLNIGTATYNQYLATKGF